MQRAEKFLMITGQPLYFAMIAKLAEHSFILIGVTDSNTKKNHILFAAGKKVNRNTSFFSLFGSGAEASLKMEGAIFEDYETGNFTSEHLTITYKAYRIEKDDYTRFLRSLQTLEESRISAFVPREQNEEGKYPFIYTEMARTQLIDPPHFAKHLKYLTASKNSCRTSAIEMLLTILDRDAKDKDISSSALNNLPYSNTIYHGQLLKLVYVLPIPPSAVTRQNHPFGDALQLIYDRLSTIPLTKPDSEITVRKFIAVKNLYDQLNAANRDFQVWTGILEKWNLMNARLINTHRGQALGEETATTKTIAAVFEKLTVGNHLVRAI